MFELIQVELTRVRRMVELADEAFLLYLIDIVIIEAKARSSDCSLQALTMWSAERGEQGLAEQGLAL